MTVYLAGPMTGYPEHNFPEFNRVAAYLRDVLEFNVLNPAENFGGNPDHSRRVYFAADTDMLLLADTLVLLPDWQHSFGAVLEVAIAQRLGLAICEARWVQLPDQDGFYYLSNVCPSVLMDMVPAKRPWADTGIKPPFEGPIEAEDPSEFERLLDKVRELHRAKRSDYTGNSGDILYNYRSSASLAHIPMATGMFARLCEKVIRCSSILDKDGNVSVKDESFKDTMMDIAIISLLIIIAHNEREPFSDW